jgi:leader peptidase (prepilin peptidase)/N-methyltransferase
MPMAVRLFAPNSSINIWIAFPLVIAMAAWATLVVPPSLALLATLLLGWTLLVLASVDAAILRLPDPLTYGLTAAGLGTAFLLRDQDFAGHVIGAVAGFAIFAAIRWLYARLHSRDGLGLGDAKLAAAAGAWLGWQALPSAVLVAALGGLATYLLGSIRRGPSALGEPLPFGVPLSLAMWLVWLYGPIPTVAPL